MEVDGNIGMNCRTNNCMVIHPAELHMIYAVGSLLVVKSVDSDRDRYLVGHSSSITYITVSKNGNLIGSAETQDSKSEELAALIVWDF